MSRSIAATILPEMPIIACLRFDSQSYRSISFTSSGV